MDTKKIFKKLLVALENNKPLNQTTAEISSIACGWTAEELYRATVVLESFNNGDHGRDTIAAVIENRMNEHGSPCSRIWSVYPEIGDLGGGAAAECFRKGQFSFWNGIPGRSGQELCNYIMAEMKRLRGAGLSSVGPKSTQAEIQAALAGVTLNPRKGKSLIATGAADALFGIGVGHNHMVEISEYLAGGCTLYANPDKITSTNETAKIIQKLASEVGDWKGKIFKITSSNYPKLYKDGVRATILYKQGSHTFSIHICKNGGLYTGCPSSCGAGDPRMKDLILQELGDFLR